MGRLSCLFVLRHTRPAGSIYEDGGPAGRNTPAVRSATCEACGSVLYNMFAFYANIRGTINHIRSLEPQAQGNAVLRCRQFMSVGLHPTGALFQTAYVPWKGMKETILMVMPTGIDQPRRIDVVQVSHRAGFNSGKDWLVLLQLTDFPYQDLPSFGKGKYCC